MATLAFRIADDDKLFLTELAKFHGKTISDFARDIIIERLEDEEDYRAVKAYEKDKADGKVKLIPFSEIVSKYGLE
jgi:predicted DNA-binding protein